MFFIRSHFGWEGDVLRRPLFTGLPNSGPKQQATGSRGPSQPWHNGQLRSSSEEPVRDETHEHMRLCYLLAGPLVVPLCTTLGSVGGGLGADGPRPTSLSNSYRGPPTKDWL